MRKSVLTATLAALGLAIATPLTAQADVIIRSNRSVVRTYPARGEYCYPERGARRYTCYRRPISYYRNNRRAYQRRDWDDRRDGVIEDTFEGINRTIRTIDRIDD